MTQDNAATFYQWFGNKSFDLDLLYRKSTDGCDAALAKQKIYKAGPTLAVYKSTSGHIFGGYTSVAFDYSPSGWKADANAFMYSLTKNAQFNVKSSSMATYFAEGTYIIVWGDMRL